MEEPGAAGAPRRRADEASLPARTLAALTEAGVRWCLLRGRDELASPAGDVDLLLGADDVAAADRVLAGLGLVRIPSWGRGSHRFYVGYDAAADGWVKLDAVTELSFGPGQALRSGAAAEVLGRRRRDGALFLPAPADAFWCLLAHCLLDRRGVPERHRPALRELAAAATEGSALARLLGAAAPDGWDARSLAGAARDGRFDELAALAPAIRRRFGLGPPATARLRTLAAASARRLTKLQVALARRGLRVALLGPDGAGKSLLAEGIASSFFLPVRVRYLGLYRPRASRPALPGSAYARRFGTVLAAAAAARVDVLRGRLVVFDRCAFDAVLRTPRRPRPGLGRRLLARAGGRLDLILVLDVPPAVALERKGERDAAELAAEREAYLALAAELPHAAVLDASRSADAVRRDAVAEIWARYGARGARR